MFENSAAVPSGAPRHSLGDCKTMTLDPRRWVPLFGIALGLLLGACAATPALVPPSAAAPATKTAALATPPVARQVPYTVASPNGSRLDPYYWLRDDSRENPEVLAYLEAENAYAEAMLAPVEPLQDRLYSEIVGRIQQDDASVPVFDNGYWYYTRFVAGQDYPVYARKPVSLEAAEEVLLDGNAMAEGLDYFQIGNVEVSPDNRWLAYAVDTVGRRQYAIRIKDLRTGATLGDSLANAEPDLAWAADNRTLLYIEKDPETLLGNAVKAHLRGAPPLDDKLVYRESDPSFYMGLATSKSGEYLFIVLQSTLVSEWRYAKAKDPKLSFRPVLPREANHEYQVQQLGREFIIRTNWQAPNFRLMRTVIWRSASKSAWKEVLAHREQVFIDDFEAYRDVLAVNERSEGLLKVRLLGWNGRRDEYISADEPAYVMGLAVLPNLQSPVVRYVYSSLSTPPTTIDHDLATGERMVMKREPVLGDFDAKNYVTEYLRAPARDGAQVPVSLVYRRGTRLDGSAPMLQYGYGSYGLSTEPAFSSARLSLLDRGFVFAIAHVRGGQELGRNWYEGGRLLNKINTFNDFVDTTEFLVGKGYAAKDRVFALGGSAGGLLMGAVANLAPEKYRGIVAHVPFVDVVTTMLDETIPLTTNEFDEWGNPKDKVYYDYMLSYSPYDQVAARDYPTMLVTTGLWDSQVQYWEPAKWVAKLRTVDSDDEPLLFVTSMEAGHGGKSGRFRHLEETARDYAFILGELGLGVEHSSSPSPR